MEKPLKVLVVSTSDSLGGAAKAAYRIHYVVRMLGVDSHMLVKNKFSFNDSVTSVSEFESVTFFYKVLKFVQNKVKNKVQHYRWSKYPNREDLFMSDLRSTSIHGALQKFDYDILHLHWINLHFLDLHELNKIGKPIVWTLHDCWPFTGICHYFYDCNRYKESCGKCPFLQSTDKKDLSNRIWEQKKKIYNSLNLTAVSPSHWLSEAAISSSLFSRFTHKVIPNPIDTELYTPGSQIEACKALKLNENKRYILYCAVNAINDINKGYEQLLKALFHFKNNKISEIELLIVGTEKPLFEKCSTIAIQYLGIISSDEYMVNVYRAASVIVVPSLSENLSTVLIESLACGTPAVAFNIGGNSDIIVHKQNGYLAGKLDTEDFFNGINWCLSNNSKGELSSNARTHVVDSFRKEKIGRQYFELYNEIINS